MPQSPLYEQDFYAWANQQAALLRAGEFAAADMESIAEEIESMGKTELRELESRLSVLLLHLLKWRRQPKGRGSSWEATIRVQRRDIARHMGRNPSLKPKLPDSLDYSYENAVIEAASETGLAEETFPAVCPWTYEQIVDPDFWPQQP